MDEIDIIKNMDEAMINSYDIIIGNTTLEELMVDRGGEGLLFAHNIENGPTKNDINSLKKYFEKVEDFERCIELSRLIS
tara:strand:+ start:570 stop:806 length:237 start_codon:yes stop_codon:yes gene_type:complete